MITKLYCVYIGKYNIMMLCLMQDIKNSIKLSISQNQFNSIILISKQIKIGFRIIHSAFQSSEINEIGFITPTIDYRDQ